MVILEEARDDEDPAPGRRATIESALELRRALKVWHLSQAEAARSFRVTRQALSKWLKRGVPANRAVAVAELTDATELLERYLKRGRIPAVVRRPIRRLDGVSLLELLSQGDTNRVLSACRDMFDFERAHR